MFFEFKLFGTVLGDVPPYYILEMKKKGKRTFAHEPDKKTQNPAEQIAKFAKEYRKICWKNNP
jgi:hypothetical protein